MSGKSQNFIELLPSCSNKRRTHRKTAEPMDNTGYGRERLKDIVEKEAEEEGEETTEQIREEEEEINLTPQEYERALKGAYRSFVIPGTPKADIDSYFDETKSHIKVLIEDQLKET